MTKFLDPKFSSRPANDKYRANYDQVFEKPKKAKATKKRARKASAVTTP